MGWGLEWLLGLIKDGRSAKSAQSTKVQSAKCKMTWLGESHDPLSSSALGLGHPPFHAVPIPISTATTFVQNLKTYFGSR